MSSVTNSLIIHIANIASKFGDKQLVEFLLEARFAVMDELKKSSDSIEDNLEALGLEIRKYEQLRTPENGNEKD